MPTICVLSKHLKNITIFHQKIIVFTAMKYCSILHRRVCVMIFVFLHQDFAADSTHVDVDMILVRCLRLVMSSLASTAHVKLVGPTSKTDLFALPGPIPRSEQNDFFALPGPIPRSEQNDFFALPGPIPRSEQNDLFALPGPIPRSEQTDFFALSGPDPRSEHCLHCTLH